MTPTVVVSAAAPIGSARAIRGSTESDVARGRRRAGRSRARASTSAAAARVGVLEQHVADRAADDRRRRRPAGGRDATSARCSRRVCARRSPTAPRSRSTARPGALVNGEADRLPALIVDGTAMRAATYLVVQTLCAGDGSPRWASSSSVLRRAAVRPRGILARNDPKVRRLEGLEERIDVLYGEVPETVERARRATCRSASTSDTDRRPGCFSTSARTTTSRRSYARGRALDAFTYNGGFALQLARAVPVGPGPRLVGGGRGADARERRGATA